MGIITAISQLALWIWFLGCTITYKTKKFLLVEGMGIKSAEFVMLFLYSIALASFYFLHVGKWILLSLLVLWAAVQFMCHWRYTIFGVSEKKLKGYNECFQNTVRLIPASTTRLVPDFYHVVLHIMIIINVVLCFTSANQ